jgi:predicted transcriptional regulator
MRTTVRIDDDLLRSLKQRAERGHLSLTEVVNQTLRDGLAAAPENRKKATKKFWQRVCNMGVPRIDISKANPFLAELDDEDYLTKFGTTK